MSRTTRIASGVYRVNGTSDTHGRPLRVVRVYDDSMYGGSSAAQRTSWELRDSRDQLVSIHFTKELAVAASDRIARRQRAVFAVDADAHGEPTLWEVTERGHLAVLRRSDLPLGSRHVWPVLVERMTRE